MNSLRKFLFLFCQLSLVVSFSFAQEKYRAVHWGNDDGLPDENHNVLIRDIHDFMWIGTPNGLSRFDGNTFKNYVPDKNKPGSIIDANIDNIIEDSLHNLWVGTGIGLSRYDIRADTFMNFPATQATYTFVIPFCSTKDEVYCLEGGWSLASYNIHTFKKKFLATISAPEYVGGDDESWHSFYDAGTNSLWLPESYFEGRSVGGLFEVSLSTGKRNSYTWPCFKNIPGHIHRIRDMRYDRKRNVVWLSTTDGLLQFTLSDKKFHHIDALNAISNQPGFIYPEGLDLDAQGRVWWCSYPAGPVIYDPVTNTYTPVFTDVSKQREVGNVNLYMYCDRDGMVWTSCSEQSKGIYQLIPASFPIVHYSGDSSQPHHLFNGTAINRVTNAGQGKLWMGVGDELNVYDTKTGSFQLISSEKDLPLFFHKVISAITVDTIHNKALFDVYDQTRQISYLYEMDIATKKCRLVIFKDSAGTTIEPPLGFTIYPYKNDAIVTGDIFQKESSNGIFAVNTDSAIARWIAPLPDYGAFIATDNNHLLFIQSRKNLTYSNRTGKWTKISSPLDSVGWSNICYNEKDSTYWVGIGDSLIHYNNDLHVIHSYAAEGTNYGDGISDIVLDNRGHVWMRFNKTISWLTIATGKITTLSEKDGFTKRILGNGLIAVNGDIYYWGGGLNRLHPDELVDNYPPSFAYFKSLEINQKPFSLPTGFNELKELSLAYNQNKISIETGAINYYIKTGTRIRYKLTGLNETWQFAPANYTIRYEGLPSGSFTLVIQASNAAGDFNGPEKKLLITISTPFWNTWWFTSTLGILLIFAFYGIYRWRTEALRKQKKVLEQTVTERTSEVVSQKKEIESQRDQVINALNDLQSAQKQLIQKEKMASLGELTAGIAHEIQNPLNFVNNFSDINKELIEELKSEKIKAQGERNEKLEDELLNDIQANEEKINHHGKRADSIVKGMLQHSRTSNSVKEPTNINALADEYLRLSYHGLRAKDKSFNATMKTDFDENIGDINIIPQDIGRVLLNLYNNAFYAATLTPQGEFKDPHYKHEPTVWVSTKKLNNNIVITVKDNGSGIPQNIVDKIFQPFFTTKPTGQGTGLGLSLSYDIIKAHGGEINVNTVPGEYTEFVVVLPFSPLLANTQRNYST